MISQGGSFDVQQHAQVIQNFISVMQALEPRRSPTWVKGRRTKWKNSLHTTAIPTLTLRRICWRAGCHSPRADSANSGKVISLITCNLCSRRTRCFRNAFRIQRYIMHVTAWTIRSVMTCWELGFCCSAICAILNLQEKFWQNWRPCGAKRNNVKRLVADLTGHPVLFTCTIC